MILHSQISHPHHTIFHDCFPFQFNLSLIVTTNLPSCLLSMRQYYHDSYVSQNQIHMTVNITLSTTSFFVNFILYTLFISIGCISICSLYFHPIIYFSDTPVIRCNVYSSVHNQLNTDCFKRLFFKNFI